MLVYSKRNSFLQRLHPLTGVMLIITYLMAVLILKNPIYLAIIFFSILFLAYIDGCLKDVFSYLKFIIPVIILVMILNPLMSHNGDTILYKSSISVPIFGVFTISLESILYGLENGVILGVVTVILGFGNLILHPDRTFGFFAKYLKKSALLMSMTIRFFPTLMNSQRNIIEVEKLRGNFTSNKGFAQRIKNQGNIANILFMTSLEDAVDVSESMYSRGFGLGKRSTYFRERFRKKDLILIFLTITELVYLFYFNQNGLNNMNFYPRCDNPFAILTFQGIVVSMLFFVPFFINWGWNVWRR
jgi:energy-coupling factor transport system permease protein